MRNNNFNECHAKWKRNSKQIEYYTFKNLLEFKKTVEVNKLHCSINRIKILPQSVSDVSRHEYLINHISPSSKHIFNCYAISPTNEFEAIIAL